MLVLIILYKPAVLTRLCPNFVKYRILSQANYRIVDLGIAKENQFKFFHTIENFSWLL